MQPHSLTINSLQDILDIEKTPLENRFSERTTYDILTQAKERYPDRSALIFLPNGDPLCEKQDLLGNQNQVTSINYSELWELVNQTAHLLTQLQVKSTDAVSYILPNIAENYFVFLAAQAVGIASPISPMLSATQMIEIIRASASRILVTHGQIEDPELWKTIQNVIENCSQIEQVLIVGSAENAILSENKKYHHFAFSVARQPKTAITISREPTEICSYFHTSGTTGTPKLSQHSHWGNVHMAWACGIFANFSAENTVILSGLPMFHVGAPMLSGLSAFMYGATVVVMSPRGWQDPHIIPNFWQLVEKYQATFAVLLPFVYKALLQVPVGETTIRSLKLVITGNIGMNATDYRAFKKISAAEIRNSWGQTEVVCMAAMNFPFNPTESHIAWRGIRFPYQPIKIVRLSKHRSVQSCAANEPGIVCLQGPNITGYQNPKLNQAAFIDGWFNTGDWGYLDNEGFLWILGRVSDFIRYQDQTISLLDIEQAFYQLPAVKKVAALGVNYGTQGEIPKVYLEIHPGQTISLDFLQNHLQSYLQKLQQKSEADQQSEIPFQIQICGTLPVNGMGKVLKYKLKEVFQEEELIV